MVQIYKSEDIIVVRDELISDKGKKIIVYRFLFQFDRPTRKNMEEFHQLMEKMFETDGLVHVEVDGRSVSCPSMDVLKKQIDFLFKSKEKVAKQVVQMKIHCGKVGKGVLNTLFKIIPPPCPVLVLSA